MTVVVGHQAENVKAALAGRNFRFVLQEPQIGTGHALLQAEPALAGADGDVLADREAAVLVVRGDLHLFEADLADRADGQAVGAALDQLLDDLDVEHDIAIEQDERVALDVRAAEQEGVRVVGAPKILVRHERDVEGREPLGHGVTHHVLEVARADDELVEAAAQKARDRPPQDRDATDRQEGLGGVVRVGTQPRRTARS